jgi:DNA polymerase III delta subunit
VAKTSKPPAALPPIAVLHGPERYLQCHHTAALRARAETLHGPTPPARFEGNSASPADILDECRSIGLIQSFKIVLVDNADALLKSADDDTQPAPAGPSSSARRGRELFEAYAKSPEPMTMLILRAAVWKPGNLDKAVLASGGEITKFEPLRPPEAAAWAHQCAKAHRTTLESGVAERLAHALGGDAGRIDAEIAKLSLVAPGHPVSLALVEEMTQETREEKFFAIQDSLVSKDAAAALAHLRDLIDVSRQDPTPLGFAYFDTAKKLHGLVRGVRQGVPVGSLFGKLKLWGTSGNAFVAAAKGMTPEAAAELLHEVLNSTVRQRTGAADPERALEALTVKFATARATRPQSATR